MSEQGRVKKGWSSNFFTVPNGIYECSVTGYAKAVYCYLCRRADGEGQSFPGYSTIAEEVGFSKSTVRRAVDELIQAGLLLKEVRGRKENGEFFPNLYTVIHPLDAVPVEVCSDRTHPPEGMLSQDIPVFSENLPMLSEDIPMLCEDTEVILIKDDPLTIPMKDKNTHTEEIEIHEENEGLERRPHRVSQEQTKRVCELLKQEGVNVSERALKRWLTMATVDDIVYAVGLSRSADNPAAYVEGVLSRGVVRVEMKPKRDPRYAKFYEIFGE